MRLSAIVNKLSATPDGDGFTARCPVHGDKTTPSLHFSVNANNNKILMVCRSQGCNVEDVRKALGAPVGWLNDVDVDMEAPRARAHATLALPLPADDIAKVNGLSSRAHQTLMSPSGADAQAWLGDRFGATDADVQRLRLGLLDGETPRLLVPMMDKDGLALGWQARALDPHTDLRWTGPKNPAIGQWTVTAVMRAEKPSDTVVVCEGMTDPIAASIAGFDAVGIRGAEHASNAKAADTIAEFANGRPVVVAGDGDAAGRKFAATLAAKLLDRGLTVRVANLPDGKDLADAHRESRGIPAVIRAASALEKPAGTAFDRARLTLTEDGAGQFFLEWVREHGSDLKFVKGLDWMVWDTNLGVWRNDTTGQVAASATVAFRQLNDHAQRAFADVLSDSNDSNEDKASAREFLKFTEQFLNLGPQERMLKMLSHDPSVGAVLDEFDAKPGLVTVANGVLDVNTGELMPADRNLLLTHRIPVPFNPAAKAPTWEKFLREAHASQPDVPAYLQRLIGYGLAGDGKEQIFVIHHGATGGNGKSTFSRTLGHVFGELTANCSMSVFEESAFKGDGATDLADFRGARFVNASEGKRGAVINESTVKMLTGGTRIKGRRLYHDSFEFDFSGLVQMETNHLPNLSGDDAAVWRRVHLVQWSRSFTAEGNVDKDLPNKLKAEAEGILAWAVRGAMARHRLGGLAEPRSVVDAIRRFEADQNPLDGFLPGSFVLDPEATQPLKTSDVYELYARWAVENGRRNPWTQRGLTKELVNVGAIKGRDGRLGMVLRGIRHATPADLMAVEAQLNSPDRDFAAIEARVAQVEAEIEAELTGAALPVVTPIAEIESAPIVVPEPVTVSPIDVVFVSKEDADAAALAWFEATAWTDPEEIARIDDDLEALVALEQFNAEDDDRIEREWREMMEDTPEPERPEYDEDHEIPSWWEVQESPVAPSVLASNTTMTMTKRQVGERITFDLSRMG